MENEPFIDDLPRENDDVPHLCISMLVSRRVPIVSAHKTPGFSTASTAPKFQATLGTPDAPTGNASRGIACRATVRGKQGDSPRKNWDRIIRTGDLT